MLDIFNPEHYRNFEGDLIPTRVKQIEKQREMEMERKRQRQLEYERKMEEQVIKLRNFVYIQKLLSF